MNELYAHEEDATLVTQTVAGNREAFRTLVRRYEASLQRLCIRLRDRLQSCAGSRYPCGFDERGADPLCLVTGHWLGIGRTAAGRTETIGTPPGKPDKTAV
jgi:hypothetical protein